MARVTPGRLTLRQPILIGTFAIVMTICVIVAWNVFFTRHYLLLREVDGVGALPPAYWVGLAVVDVALAAIIASLVTFVVTNARAILLVRRQDSFVDGVSHELKSPLASLRLCLDTVERRQLEGEDRARFMKAMRRDVDRLQLFIEHILEAGRLQNNERPVESVTVELAPLVERCVEQIAERHATPRERFCVNVAAGARTVSDPVAIEIALLNLLDNAVKYSASAASSPIGVTLREQSGGFEIAVQDAGSGLARRELKRVFNRFYRVAATRRIRGTGLGLFVSRGLVRRLGGDIVAQSEGVGLGSRFTITLPLVRTAECAAPHAALVAEGRA